MLTLALLALAAAPLPPAPPDSPPPFGPASSPSLVAEAPPVRAEPPRAFLWTVAEGSYAAYKQTLSRAKGPSCSFFPSCSAYGREAISRFGLPGGLVLFGARLMKAHVDGDGFYARRGHLLLDPLDENTGWLSLDAPRFRWVQLFSASPQPSSR